MLVTFLSCFNLITFIFYISHTLSPNDVCIMFCCCCFIVVCLFVWRFDSFGRLVAHAVRLVDETRLSNIDFVWTELISFSIWIAKIAKFNLWPISIIVIWITFDSVLCPSIDFLICGVFIAAAVVMIMIDITSLVACVALCMFFFVAS